MPYLDGLKTRRFADSQAAYAAFLAGQLDVMALSGPSVKDYLSRQGPGFTPSWFADTVVQMVYPNSKVKPFDDARVRRALRLRLDHKELLDVWVIDNQGKGQYGSVFPTALQQWDLTQEEYEKMIFWKSPKDEAAREALNLLRAAGFDQANPLKFKYMTGGTSTDSVLEQLIQSQFSRYSQRVVDTELEFADSAQYTSRLAQRAFEYAQAGQSGNLTEPDAWLSDIQHSAGSRNYASWSDPKADSMIERQRGILNTEERKALIKEILLYVIDNTPQVIPANRYHLMGVSRKIRGYVPEGGHMRGRQYEWVWIDA
jgi:ABC-type oligopeptide transport system substrate-binding subunit